MRMLPLLLTGLLAATGAYAQDAHEHHGGHDLPPPPEATGPRDPHAWSDGLQHGQGAYAVTEPLHLHDTMTRWQWRADRLEWGRGEENLAAFEGLVDVGRTFSGWRLKAEAEAEDGALEHHRLELVHRRAIAPFWDLQLGLRHDGGDAASRGWAGVGIEGLAPYWFELDVSAWLGESGRTALSLEAEYEWRLGQRWMLQPRLELNAYGKDDPAAGTGDGLADLASGLRLRYEYRREFAPYVGVEWVGRFGDTADMLVERGGERRELRWLIGLRMWY